MSDNAAAPAQGGQGGNDAPANLSNFHEAMKSVDMSGFSFEGEAPARRGVANDNGKPAVGLPRPPNQPDAADDPEAMLAAEDGAEEPPQDEFADDEEQQTEQAADPLDEEIHGLKAREVLDALKKGEMPRDMLDKLLIEVKPNGEPRMVSIAEASQGYMRQVDYTRGKQEMAEQRREHAQFKEDFNASIDRWKDPMELQRGLKKLGLHDALYNAAYHIAQEEAALARMSDRERELYLARKAEADKREAAEEELRRIKMQSEGRKVSAAQRKNEQALEQYTPLAYQQSGLKETPVTREIYVRHLRALLADGGEITLEVCQQAAASTAEEMGDIAKRIRSEQQPTQGGIPTAGRPQQAQQQRPSPLGPRRAASAAPTQVSARQKGGNVGDFYNTFLKRGGAR